MSQPILMAPNATGSGHNMRALALTRELRALDPAREIVVLLGSMQDVFEPLFASTGARVISTENGVVNHAKSGHLDKILDREHFVDGYLVPTFLNGSKTAGWSPNSPLPLGLQLRGAHTLQHREILAIGVDEESHQAFKEYVIETTASPGRIYIKELFSSFVAPIAGARDDSLLNSASMTRLSESGRNNL